MLDEELVRRVMMIKDYLMAYGDWAYLQNISHWRAAGSRGPWCHVFLWNVFGVGDVHWKTVCENVEGGKLNVEPNFFHFLCITICSM